MRSLRRWFHDWYCGAGHWTLDKRFYSCNRCGWLEAYRTERTP